MCFGAIELLTCTWDFLLILVSGGRTHSEGPVADVGLRGIVNAVSHLTSLEIVAANYITVHSLMIVANESHHLQCLRLCKCGRIMHKGILAIANHCLLLSELTVFSGGMDPSLVDAVEDDMPVKPGGVVHLALGEWPMSPNRLYPCLEHLYLVDTMITDTAIADIIP